MEAPDINCEYALLFSSITNCTIKFTAVAPTHVDTASFLEFRLGHFFAKTWHTEELAFNCDSVNLLTTVSSRLFDLGSYNRTFQYEWSL
jgi:hypothetical protein